MIELKLNPDNPRTISKDKFQKLMQSIKEFPKMMELRPVIYDDELMILGGNMRYRALQELEKQGFEIKDSWFRKASDLNEEEKRRFVIEDNVPFGDWDWDVLANKWEDLPLMDWGLKPVEVEEKVEPEVEFTEELMEEHNYIVLYFDNEIDWLQLQSLYPLKTVDALSSKAGYRKRGIGRVVNGRDFLNKIVNK